MATLTQRNIPLGTFTNDRKDNWWIKPLIQGGVIVIFVIYTLVALFIFGEESAKFGNLLSPIFGVEIPKDWLTSIGWPKVANSDKYLLAPALLVIWAPTGFRATCYYMRRIYYRSFFGNPPACATNGINFRRGKYTGERWLPFVLNNFHRYFLYTAILIALFHWFELLTVTFFIDGAFAITLGSLILLADTTFLTFYIGSCHAFRHLMGGGSNCYSCSGVKNVQHKAWKFISRINENHGNWFWLSLISVMVADVYIRLLNWGMITNFRFF